MSTGKIKKASPVGWNSEAVQPTTKVASKTIKINQEKQTKKKRTTKVVTVSRNKASLFRWNSFSGIRNDKKEEKKKKKHNIYILHILVY